MPDRRFTSETVPCSYDGPICEVIGDPHYRTFDGYWHHFQGKCEYVLTQLCLDENGNDFIISAGNFGHEGSDVSCVGFVRITIESEGIEILFERGGTITINGVQLPIGMIYSTPSVEVFHSGGNPMVELKTQGVRVFYDGIFRVKVTVSQSLEGQLCGLCGTYNGTIFDDLRAPDGTIFTLPEFSESVEIYGLIEDYGNTWLREDPTDPECSGNERSRRDAPGVGNCTSDPVIVDEGRRRCGVLEINPGPFSACHGVVNVTQYVNNCEFDYCCCNETEREDCYCDALSSYASACADAGVTINNWRSSNVCRKFTNRLLFYCHNILPIFIIASCL